MNDFVNLTVLISSPNRCQHLDSDGKRCKKKSYFRGSYHGDNEIYDNDATGWVSIELCEAHGRPTFNVPHALSPLPHYVYRKVKP